MAHGRVTKWRPANTLCTIVEVDSGVRARPRQPAPRGLYAAILLAEDVFTRLASAQLINDARAATLTCHLFDNEPAASAWLLRY